MKHLTLHNFVAAFAFVAFLFGAITAFRGMWNQPYNHLLIAHIPWFSWVSYLGAIVGAYWLTKKQ